jgi:hypothetical protein
MQKYREGHGGGSGTPWKDPGAALVGPAGVELQIFGTAEVAAMFGRLSVAAQSRVLKPIMVSASGQIAEALRGAAPEESGLLKRAMGSSVLKTYGETLFITAGVRRGFRRAVSLARTGRWRIRGKKATGSAGGETIRDPAKYLHLVTGGRKAVEAINARVLYSAQSNTFFGRRAKAVAPRPFVQQTFGSVASAVSARICQEAAGRIVEEASR